jgi:hypothetical protein
MKQAILKLFLTSLIFTCLISCGSDDSNSSPESPTTTGNPNSETVDEETYQGTLRTTFISGVEDIGLSAPSIESLEASLDQIRQSFLKLKKEENREINESDDEAVIISDFTVAVVNGMSEIDFTEETVDLSQIIDVLNESIYQSISEMSSKEDGPIKELIVSHFENLLEQIIQISDDIESDSVIVLANFIDALILLPSAMQEHAIDIGDELKGITRDLVSEYVDDESYFEYILEAAIDLEVSQYLEYDYNNED